MLVSGKLANSQSFDFVCVTGLVLVGSTQPFSHPREDFFSTLEPPFLLRQKCLDRGKSSKLRCLEDLDTQ